MSSPLISFRLSREEVQILQRQALEGESFNRTCQRLLREMAEQADPSLQLANSAAKFTKASVSVNNHDQLTRGWVEGFVETHCAHLMGEVNFAIASLRQEVRERLGEIESLRNENDSLRQQAQVGLGSGSVYEQIKAERDKLDAENLQLHERNGDLDLEVQKLQEELRQMRIEQVNRGQETDEICDRENQKLPAGENSDRKFQLLALSEGEVKPLENKTLSKSRAQLARRLNVAPDTLTRKRFNPDFPEWCQKRDPKGLAWQFVVEKDLYTAVNCLPSDG